MRLHKFSDVDAFVALDLDGAETASGPVRWARKVLQGGAKDLARSQTYTYAVLRMRRSGASAGISSDASARAEAVTGFVAEAAALASGGVYLPDAAKGVTEDDLASLRDADPRTAARLGGFASECDALSAVAAADAAVGIDGRSVVLEGFSAAGPTLVEAVTRRGGRVVGVATAEGSLATPEGCDPAAVSEAWAASGKRTLESLAEACVSDGLDEPDALWGIAADVVFAGSRMGVVDHGVAERLQCLALVPSGRLAYTAKALAVCRKRDIVAVPDFVSLAGSTIAAWSSTDISDDEVRAAVAETVSSLMSEALDSADGAFLGACCAAEAFLSTWRDELPFGRPLAS
ncbi:MAG: hypothetical protein OXE79_05950 [Acidimicrobiaceae bacterium]|nr:hypothetical protein [Acidimicrobiaceae bacterium]MCY4280262.1 hypothetical protein [Acidimicrobiaceae bacterium]MCY4293557.1 hypothetical protein [Acidimicrobiaceae bacterium]